MYVFFLFLACNKISFSLSSSFYNLILYLLFQSYGIIILSRIISFLLLLLFFIRWIFSFPHNRWCVCLFPLFPPLFSSPLSYSSLFLFLPMCTCSPISSVLTWCVYFHFIPLYFFLFLLPFRLFCSMKFITNMFFLLFIPDFSSFFLIVHRVVFYFPYLYICKVMFFRVITSCMFYNKRLQTWRKLLYVKFKASRW